jgi:hypothetical protein
VPDSSQVLWLTVVAKILLQRWHFRFPLLPIWLGCFLLASHVIYNLHGSLFDLGPHRPESSIGRHFRTRRLPPVSAARYNNITQ